MVGLIWGFPLIQGNQDLEGPGSQVWMERNARLAPDAVERPPEPPLLHLTLSMERVQFAGESPVLVAGRLADPSVKGCRPIREREV